MTKYAKNKRRSFEQKKEKYTIYDNEDIAQISVCI